MDKKKLRAWQPRIGFLLLCVMAPTSVILCCLGRFPLLERAWTFNIGMDLLGIMATLAIYYSTISGRGGDDGISWFSAMLFSIAAGLFLDECAWLVQGVPSLRIANIVVNALFYAVSPIIIFQFWKYICVVLRLSGRIVQTETAVLRTLSIPATLLCLSNLVFPLYFSVDADGVYQRGNYYWLSMTFMVVAYVVIFRELIVNKLALRERLTVLSFVALPLLAQAVTIGMFGISTQYGALFISVVLMYGVLFSERGKTLAATETELSMATSIQANMLPNVFPAFPKRSEFDLYATMDPAKEVGGDFYDFFLIDDDHLALVMADVSGKGVPAALFMMTARTMLKTQAQMQPDPARVLTEVNAMLTENNKESMFVTVWLGILQISTGVLTYADAGHEKLLLYQDGAWRFLPKGTSMALAVLQPEEFDALPDSYRYRNETIQLHPGDMVFQYTDGVTEAADAADQMFGEERLLASINAAGTMSPDELLPHIRQCIDSFAGAVEQFDDITMLVMRYQGSGAGES